MYHDILEVITSSCYIYRIPLGRTSLLRMAGLPVEVDIGLTSLTLTNVFETAVEVNRTVSGDKQVDRIYVIDHTVQHVLLVNHDLFLAGCNFIVGVRRTVCRALEGHLDGHVSGSGTFVTIGELRLVLSQCVHVSHTEGIQGLTGRNNCTLDGCVGRIHIQNYGTHSARSRNNRNDRLINHLHLHLHRLLQVLDSEIELIRIDTRDHALRDGVDYGLTGSERVITSGSTG